MPRHDCAAKRSSKFEAREEQGRAPLYDQPAPRAREQETDSPVGPGEMRAGTGWEAFSNSAAFVSLSTEK